MLALRCGEIVSVDVPEPVIDDGLKLELVRDGTPDTLRFTVPLKGPVAEPAIVTV